MSSPSIARSTEMLKTKKMTEFPLPTLRIPPSPRVTWELLARSGRMGKAGHNSINFQKQRNHKAKKCKKKNKTKQKKIKNRKHTAT